MNQNECGIIKDLLPLYADEVCSENSRGMVAKHIESCAECRAELKKMGRSIKISADKDIAVVKRIKRRIRIEKAVIGFAVLVVLALAMVIGYIYLIGYQPLELNESFIAENISVFEDEEGTLWLETKGDRLSYDAIQPDLIDGEKRHMDDAGFDRDTAHTFAVTFIEARASRISKSLYEKSHYVNDGRESYTRTRIGSNPEGIDTIVYYDRNNEKEYIIWERGENE